VNASRWDATLEERSDHALALRLGFRQIDGFRQDWADEISAYRNGFYPSVEMIQRRAHLPARALILLAEADAMRSLGLDRREAAWEVRRLPDSNPLLLFEAARARELADEPLVTLPTMPLSEHVVADYQTLRLSLKGHPMLFLRDLYQAEGVTACAALRDLAHGRRVRAAGIVLVRQKPGSAKGVVFMTIEDETGIANCVVWPSLLEPFRKVVMGARLVRVDALVQRSEEGIVHLVVEEIFDRSSDLGFLSMETLPVAVANADEVRRPVPEGRHRHPRLARIMPKSRDFH
jgi:error-prone DNA polymerase